MTERERGAREREEERQRGERGRETGRRGDRETERRGLMGLGGGKP